MIKNERQYRITRAEAEKFTQALRHASEQRTAKSEIHPLLRKAQEDAIRSQLDDLRAELAEYEALISGKISVAQVESLDDLPRALIRARIAKGLSQKELAERLDLKEQQVQRYEATEYASASLTRILEIAHCLGVGVRPNLLSRNKGTSVKRLLSRMKEVGFQADFVLKRLLPSWVVARLEVHDADQEDRVALEAAGRIGRMFGWTVEEIFGAAPLRFERSALATARFKGPSARFEKRESAYVVYVHLLAMSVLQGSRGLHMREIPTSSAEFRESVLSEYGAMSFESALNHVWDVGVPVLPLNDPAVFHGACWRVEGRNIIVLKQRTLSASRWLFDLLHEVWHVAQNPKERELSVLESDVSSNERRDSVEEREASQFAGDVLLGGRAEELAELCVEDAKGQLEWLKAAIPRVASREGVSIDCLANYMAFRLSLQGENWWGAANNLQDLSVNPWRVARDRLLTKIDLGRINEAEQTLLVQAMIVEDCDPNA